MQFWQGVGVGAGLTLLCVFAGFSFLVIFRGVAWAELVIALERLRREIQADVDAEKIKSATVREIAAIRTSKTG
jgi:hypothetical protein